MKLRKNNKVKEKSTKNSGDENRKVNKEQKSLKNLLINQSKQGANKNRAKPEEQQTLAYRYIKKKLYVYNVRKTND